MTDDLIRDDDVSSHDDSDDPTRAADGRVPGRRGMATRERLLKHTLQLLETAAYRDLKVVDIAREAGTSPATFYQYFPDAESAVLALADRLIGESGQRLTAPFNNAVWEGRDAYDACVEISRAFLSFWEDHSSLMAVIDLAALEGDERFRDCRIHLLSQFTLAASGVIKDQQKQGFVDLDTDPLSTAVVMVSMLAHVAAHQYALDRAGVNNEKLVQSMSRMLYSGVVGRNPPSA